MPRFSRGNNDVLDLPEMHRRGLVKFPEPEKEIDEIDFTLKNESQSEDTPIEKKDNSEATGFLNDFASIGSLNTAPVSENSRNNLDNLEHFKIIQDLKWRIENTEYKMEQLIERLAAIERKVT